MIPTTHTAKTRTVALPKIQKGGALHDSAAKANSASLSADGAWNGIIFGPYLVPLSRRAE